MDNNQKQNAIEFQEKSDETEKQIAEKNFSQLVTYSELFKQVMPYAIISFGGPMAHIGMFERKFVHQLKWISQQKFSELFALCQSIPGPTSSQLLLAIGTIKTNSLMGGIYAFLIFALPSALVLLFFGLMEKHANDERIVIPQFITLALKGFQCAAVGLVGQAAYSLGKKQTISPLHYFILFGSSILFYFYQTTIFMLFLLMIGAVMSVYLQKPKIEEQINKQSTQIEQNQNQELELTLLNKDTEKQQANDSQVQDLNIEQKQNNQKNVKKSKAKNNQKAVIQKEQQQQWSSVFGFFSFQLYLIILIILLILRYLIRSKLTIYVSSFYYIGSLIIGGGHVILPLMLSEFLEDNYITETGFWNGFSIVSALPGPMFNLAMYVGALIDGLRGGILGWIFLFTPSFLMIWGLLPYWDMYRKLDKVQKVLQGLGCVSVGFIYTALAMLLKLVVQVNPVTSFALAAISFILLQIYDQPAPLIIFIGGIYFNIMELFAKGY